MRSGCRWRGGKIPAARRDPLSLGIGDAGLGDDDADSAEYDDPTRKSEIFSTAPTARRALRCTGPGERPLARDNRRSDVSISLGCPRRPGVPQSRSRSTSRQWHRQCVGEGSRDRKEQKITITASSGLSKDEVDKIARAESHAEDDKKRREEIETTNRADQAVYAAERLVKMPATNCRLLIAPRSSRRWRS